VSGIPFHKQACIAIPAIDLATGVRIQAIVKNLGLVENAFGLNFFDMKHGSFCPELLEPVSK
jgi:hypothetical protein